MEEKINILIVDDDKATRRILTLLLENEGYETEAVGMGYKALEKAREKFFNLVLLDLKLPDIEGIELIAPLKKIHLEIAIVMITGYASTESAIVAINKGATAYIIKPFIMDDILPEVKKIVEKQRLVMDKRRAEIALVESEERLKKFMDSATNGIVLYDSELKLIRANKAALQIIKKSKEKVIGKNILEIEPDIKEKGRYDKYLEVIKTGKPLHIDYIFKLPEYEKVHLSVKVFKVGNGLGIITTDISERKKVEQLKEQFKNKLEIEVKERTKELNEILAQQKLYLDEIAKASQFKTEFMSTMSHELRTPLNTIIGFSDLLLEQSYGKLNEKQLEFLKNIRSSGSHLLDMISEILDISKIEAGRFSLNFEEFQLNTIVDQIKLTIKPFYRKKKLKFKVIGLNTEKNIYADPIRFKEILYNLLSNAIKFTIEGQITLIVQENYKNWTFKVKDTGIGIAPKDYDLIFKDFKRVQDPYVQSIPGTGLGLALTKKLVNLHGGNIYFTSGVGKGSTFIFTIPKKSQY